MAPRVQNHDVRPATALAGLDVDLFDLLPAAVYVCEAPSGVIRRFNQRAVELWGRTPALGEVCDRFCGSHRLIHPDGTSLAHDESPMATVLATGDPVRNQEVVIERPDGTSVTVNASISPLKDDDGRVVGAVNVFQDISARKRADVLIQGQKQALEMIARGAPLPAVLEALCRMVEEQSRGDAVAAILLLDADGVHLRDGAAPGLPTSYREAIDGIAIGPEVGTCAAAAYLGKPIVTEDIDAAPSWQAFKHLPLGLGLKAVWSMPIASASGQVLGTIGTYFREKRGPMPEERQAVELLAQTAAIAIERQQFDDAKREAERRKDEFLAMLAHELRNPLAPIRTAAQLLGSESGSDPSVIARVHAVVERQVQNMVRLLDDLLDVSRITRGVVELHLQTIDAVELVDRALDTAGPNIAARGHSLRVQRPDTALPLHGDATRLEQVVVNLLSNAAKYTDPGGIIDVAIEADERQVVIRVADNGQGIAPELLPHVFDLFRQGERTLERAHGGLGVGLTIVQRLVQMHGGRVEARSEGPGFGSEFIVRLPRTAGAAHAPARRAERSIRPRQILIVEDQADSAEMLAMLLRTRGHDVLVAANGTAALERLKTSTPDVALIDIGLPGLNGYDLARAVRQTPGLDRALLVALTGYGQPEDRARALAAGFDHHLVKPVDITAIEKLLRRESSRTKRG